MKSVFVIILTVFSWLFVQNKNDILVWNENRPLTWNDFRGKPQKRFAAASTVYKMQKEISQNDKVATIKIEAIFFCNDSWKKNEWIDNSILKHEQKHFDIVELFCRKLRKYIHEQHYATYPALVNDLEVQFGTINKDMDVYQDKYDDQTDGSMNGDKQKEWNIKIEKELAALKDFKNASVTVNLK